MLVEIKQFPYFGESIALYNDKQKANALPGIMDSENKVQQPNMLSVGWDTKPGEYFFLLQVVLCSS